MWVVKLVLVLIVLSVIVYGFVENADQSVDLSFFGREYLDVNLYWVVVAAFGLGFLAGVIAMIAREFRHQRELRRLRRQSSTMNKELADLRALPLHDLAGPATTKDD